MTEEFIGGIAITFAMVAIVVLPPLIGLFLLVKLVKLFWNA